ncbi:uncharacterized protein VTP21DRAFT_1642 [Calcarisporiella thermophila]|uniref:uncharacterized protein n=1 Tax=Calcarisporiella thermophila TaxID=911321 RepID=UPI003743265E
MEQEESLTVDNGLPSEVGNHNNSGDHPENLRKRKEGIVEDGVELKKREKKKKKKKNEDDEVIPPPPNKPNQCHYYVKRKKRYCHLATKLGNRYCGEHLIHDVNAYKKRIPCPYDPSHTVFEEELEKHLSTRCNARPELLQEQPFFRLDANCTLPPPDDEHNTMHLQLFKRIPGQKGVMLSELDPKLLQALIDRVRHLHTRYVPELQLRVEDHEALQRKREKTRNYKHADQQASLIGHMKRLGMLEDKSACFVEFGAGRGELSSYCRQALNDSEGKSTFILVDRKITRGKFDNAILGEGPNKPIVKRVTIDIKDLDLMGVPEIRGKKVIAFSKHLCGAATDLTLKCLANYIERLRSEGIQDGSAVAGVVIALCCHQLCRWHLFPNHEYLREAEIDEENFARITRMSSWGICGQRPTVDEHTEKETDKKEEEEEEEKLTKREMAGGVDEGNGKDVDHVGSIDEDSQGNNEKHFSGLPFEEREQLGLSCKRILDVGRLQFLQTLGFNVELVRYVDPSISLENVAIMAVPSAK